MSFTVLVVVHDSRRPFERLLDSLAEHLSAAPQIVVVDTGSSDGDADLARGRGADVIELPGNPGFGPANNRGLAAVRHDVVALLNPDVELRDAGLERLAELAGARDALLAPGLLNPDGTRQRSAHPRPGGVGALLPALLPSAALPRPLRLRAEPWRADSPRVVGWAIAAALVARTATLRALGPFDPEAFLYAEDLDLCLRADGLGVPTELHPEVRLVHTGAHATSAAFGGEPHERIARRRREVVRARLGRRALALDDLAQGLTFSTRVAGRALLRRDSARERAQLRALLRARRAAQ